MNAERLLQHYERIADAPDSIARLRRFVLDLAVRGKLVPQDANDEPASELLNRIAKEKVRLVKAGEIRKPKELPEVEEPPFDLPQNWCWTPIREVASDRGQEIPRSRFTYIDVTAIDKEAGVVADPKVLEASEAPSRARKITRKGDVIYSCVRPYLLNVAVIETDFDPQPIASTAFAILNGHGLVMPRYLWIVLRSPFMVACVEENQRGQAYPAINDADFAVLPFALPPLPEQHRIVAKVDELMGLCDRLEAAREVREATRDRLAAASLARLNAPDPETFHADARFALDALPAMTTRPDQIKQLRQTILNLAVRGKLVPQEANDEPASDVGLKIKNRNRGQIREAIEPPHGLPIGWAWRAVDTLADQVTDGEHATPPRISESQVPLVTAKNVREGFMDYSQTDWVSFVTAQKAWGRCRPQVGDLLLVCVGATTGRLTVLREPRDMVLVRSVALIRPNSDADTEYLERAFRSPFVQQQIWASVKAAAQPCLYINRIQSLLIPLPPLAEQHRIVAKVDALIALCDQLEASLTATAALRGHLLDALLAEALAPADALEMEAPE
jgi:type I restriction enzyme, S subunit